MRKTLSTLVLVCLVSAAVAAQAADQIIFLVRHAERADAGTQPTPMNTDPPLSAAGQARAQRLAAMLSAAGVAHVFTTEFQRTQQTAAPLAASAHLTPVVIPSGDLDALVNRLRKANGAALVVGHTNTLPDILKKLGVATQVSIAENEFDNLFVVIRRPSGAATLVRLKY